MQRTHQPDPDPDPLPSRVPASHSFEAGAGTPADRGFDLLDNAVSKVTAILPEIVDQKNRAADRSLPLDERIEAFEDIFDSEVGDTSLTRARNVEREYGISQLYLKFDGGNPTGSQKDRIAFAQVLDAMRRNYETVSLATCGNYGSAMAFAASLAGIDCRIYIPEKYHTRRLSEMERFGARIVRTPYDYEYAVQLSSEAAEREELYDANPGGRNTVIQLRAYGEIAYEIYDELRDAPAAVAVPVSNGTTLAGIYRGFVSLYRRGKTSRIPRIIAGSSHSKNPIINAFRKNLDTCEDLNPNRIRESHVNEPLINWHSIDGDLALQAIRRSGGWAVDASDRALLALSRQLRDQEGLHVMPAATAGIAAILQQHRATTLPNDRYVVILTARRSS
ncbi:pyridoxal-phosphate dependent enzyme [Salinispira pacifica]